MQFPIIVGLRRSRILAGGLSVIALTVGGLGWLWLRSTGNFALFLSLAFVVTAWSWRRLVPSVVALKLERNGGIALRVSEQGEWQAARLMPNPVVHHWLTVFRLVGEDGVTYPLVLAPDSTMAKDFRQLRVFLRWRATNTAVSADDGA